jgi:hypothetical protein
MINWGTIIVSFVSFLLGLLGSVLVQWWGDRIRLGRIKGALQNTIPTFTFKPTLGRS